MAQCEADLTRELAELELAAGKPADAAEQFRAALRLKQPIFRSRMKPIQYDIRFFFENKFRDKQYEEPELFCDYIETQIRLSQVLRELGRPHEAELQLAEAERMSLVGWGSHEYVLRYGVALANSRAELSLLLAPHRPEESQRAASAAADTWYDLLQVQQRASFHRSGVHGMQRDLKWFQSTFPQEDVVQRNPERQTKRMNCPVFWHHGLGVQELEAGYFEDAIGDFSASHEKRSEGHAFDWLYLAWAHWKLDQKDKAREWLNKTDQWIQQQPQRDVELDELRSQVAQIMNE